MSRRSVTSAEYAEIHARYGSLARSMVYSRYGRGLDPGAQESLALDAIWRAAQYHDPARGDFTTILGWVARSLCRRERLRDRPSGFQSELGMRRGEVPPRTVRLDARARADDGDGPTLGELLPDPAPPADEVLDQRRLLERVSSLVVEEARRPIELAAVLRHVVGGESLRVVAADHGILRTTADQALRRCLARVRERCAA